METMSQRFSWHKTGLHGNNVSGVFIAQDWSAWKQCLKCFHCTRLVCMKTISEVFSCTRLVCMETISEVFSCTRLVCMKTISEVFSCTRLVCMETMSEVFSLHKTGLHENHI